MLRKTLPSSIPSGKFGYASLAVRVCVKQMTFEEFHRGKSLRRVAAVLVTVVCRLPTTLLFNLIP